MNIGLLSILHNREWDFRFDLAQTYANALKNAIELQLDNDIEKQHGYFLSKKGYRDKDGKTVGANFEDKLYVGNIHRIENHLYWNDEELQDDDQIIDVVVVDGPITRDGGGCSYGSKDWRDQVMYANTIPQVVGHLFMINTPGGEASSRNDYEMMINDCREKGKPTVAFVDGMCCSSGVNLASRCDRVVVMNPRDEFGCIGTMAAFWAVAHDTVDQDGFRYVELVGKDCPEKNAWWREAAKGEYEKLQADLDKDTVEFHNTVREGRPLVTDDMLSGKVFEAQEVIPALVDEIGDMERAIECIFQLAGEELTAARFMTAPDPEEKPEDPEPSEHIGDDQTDRQVLPLSRGSQRGSEQGNNAGDQTTPNPIPEQSSPTRSLSYSGGEAIAEDKEATTSKNDTEMTEQETKAAEELQAAQAAAQEGAEQPEEQEETPATEAIDEQSETLATEGTQEAPATEEQPAAEEAPATEEATAEEQPAEEEATEGAQEPAAEQPADEEAPAAEEAPAEEQPSDETIEAAQAEIDKISETLHNAEQMIADKDKEIADLKADKDTLNGLIAKNEETIEEMRGFVSEKDKTIEDSARIIAEKQAEIDKLTKQVADLKAEVKELSGKETPMVDAAAGVPAGNGTGNAPKQAAKRITRENMTYAHCREVAKERMSKK